MITFECLKSVHDFIWHSSPPYFLSVRPPHNELVSKDERYIHLVLVLPLLVLFDFDGEHIGRSSA